MAQDRPYRETDDFDPPVSDGDGFGSGSAEEYLMDRDLDLNIRRCGDVSQLVNAIVVGILTEACGESGLTRFPTEPPEGAVLKWEKAFDTPKGASYTYVALRAGGKWYLTGRRTAGVTWSELVELIGNCPCELAVDWAGIPRVESEPVEELTPAQWYACHMEERDS